MKEMNCNEMKRKLQEKEDSIKLMLKLSQLLFVFVIVLVLVCIFFLFLLSKYKRSSTSIIISLSFSLSFKTLFHRLPFKTSLYFFPLDFLLLFFFFFLPASSLSPSGELEPAFVIASKKSPWEDEETTCSNGYLCVWEVVDDARI